MQSGIYIALLYTTHFVLDLMRFVYICYRVCPVRGKSTDGIRSFVWRQTGTTTTTTIDAIGRPEDWNPHQIFFLELQPLFLFLVQSPNGVIIIEECVSLCRGHVINLIIYKVFLIRALLAYYWSYTWRGSLIVGLNAEFCNLL